MPNTYVDGKKVVNWYLDGQKCSKVKQDGQTIFQAGGGQSVYGVFPGSKYLSINGNQHMRQFIGASVVSSVWPGVIGTLNAPTEGVLGLGALQTCCNIIIDWSYPGGLLSFSTAAARDGWSKVTIGSKTYSRGSFVPFGSWPYDLTLGNNGGTDFTFDTVNLTPVIFTK